MKLSGKNYKRVVVKIGSSLFYAGGQPDTSVLSRIIAQLSSLIGLENKEVVIVSSGAIALGMGILGLKSRPRDLPSLQAAAAIGQNVLMDNYTNAFRKHKIGCAQVLLTGDDFHDRNRYLNAKNTLARLLEYGRVPVINENDTVSTEEIKFGDNDRLSALVAALVGADILVILSDVEGLLDREKKVIRIVDGITPQIRALAMPTEKKTSVGGMITKIDAAKIAADSGIPCLIANGRHKDILLVALSDPACCGTLFIAKKNLAARERWIAFGTKLKGRVLVDEGAKGALLNKKSLLCVGVIATEGSFERGDIVGISTRQGTDFARGKVNLGSREIDKNKGRRFDKEAIHRDNIVIIQG